MSNGFYKRRRGILEHLEAGTIGLLDLAIHDYLNLKANLQIGSDCSIPPGVCFTSAVAIHALCPKEISERTVRRSLEYLEKIGWIKRWLRPGKRGNYAVLICRAGVHDLSGVEYRINGAETTDWRKPVVIPAADCPQSGLELSGYREVRIKNREKSSDVVAKKASPPADGRFKPFIEFAFIAFEGKYNYKPTWGTGEFTNLSKFLKQHPEIPYRELSHAFTKYLASDSTYYAEKGHKLTVFLKDFDGLRAPGDAPRNGSRHAAPHIPTAADCRPSR